MDYEEELNRIYEARREDFESMGALSQLDQLLEFTYYGEYKVSLEMFESLVRGGRVSLHPKDLPRYRELCRQLSVETLTAT